MRSHVAVKLARQVRFAWDVLAEVGSGLLDENQSKLCSDCFDLELQLVELHGRILELTKDAVAPPPPEELPGLSREIPF